MAVAPRILLGTDFSPASEPAFDAAMRIAQDLKAALVLVHVEPLSASPVDAQSQAMAALGDAAVLTTSYAERARAAGLAVKNVILRGDAAKGILETAQREGGTLIVVGTHGRTGLRRIVLGSVAQAVVRAADRPVLVVPSGLGVASQTGATQARAAQ